MKKNSVRWAKKQWSITERLSEERRADDATAAAMELALRGPLRITMVPVDQNNSEHWEDEEPALKTVLPDEILLRSTNTCVGDTYEILGVNLYVRGNFVMYAPLNQRLYVVRANHLSLQLSIKTPDPLSRLSNRALFQ